MAKSEVDFGRRSFLKGQLPRARAAIRPPWSLKTTIAASCTGCGACVAACPQAIIRLDDQQQPEIDFGGAECTFCGRCAEACPEPVFDRGAPAFEHVASIGQACFAARGIVCQSCGDACPEMAISFPMRLGGPALPTLAGDRCTGCGACIAACPATAISAGPRNAEAAHA